MVKEDVWETKRVGTKCISTWRYVSMRYCGNIYIIGCFIWWIYILCLPPFYFIYLYSIIQNNFTLLSLFSTSSYIYIGIKISTLRDKITQYVIRRWKLYLDSFCTHNFCFFVCSKCAWRKFMRNHPDPEFRHWTLTSSESLWFESLWYVLQYCTHTYILNSYS